LKEIAIDVQQLSVAVVAKERDFQTLMATVRDRQRDDSTHFEMLETTMDSVLKSIATLDSGSRFSSSSSSF